MSWVDDKEELTKIAKKIDGAIYLTTKDNWFWSMLGTILSVVKITTKEEFGSKFATTIGPVISFPRSWSKDSVERTLSHEGGHVKQFRMFGLYVIPYVSHWLGLIGMVLFYVLLLPVGFNWFRYRLELHAESKKWEWMLAHGYSEYDILYRARSFARLVGSKSYGWPVPQKWAVWGFDRKAKKMREK